MLVLTCEHQALPVAFSEVRYVDICRRLARRLNGEDRGAAMVLILVYFDVVRRFEAQHPGTSPLVYRAGVLLPLGVDTRTFEALLLAELSDPADALQAVRLCSRWYEAVADCEADFPLPPRHVWTAASDALRDVLRETPGPLVQ